MPTDEEFLKFKDAFNKYKKIILIGNGGSNAIASHLSQDYVKRCNKSSLAFTDSSMLTCFINDYGLDNAYVKFLKFYADKETLVILISSSGNSMNIVNCVSFCEGNKIPYGTLTAFKKNNLVRMASISPEFQYHIDTDSYGVAECVHQIFLHTMTE